MRDVMRRDVWWNEACCVVECVVVRRMACYCPCPGIRIYILLSDNPGLLSYATTVALKFKL